jgi:hypothetical protein
LKHIINTHLVALLLAAATAHATGLATCEPGPKSGWRPMEKLEKQLVDQNGWKMRCVK